MHMHMKKASINIVKAKRIHDKKLNDTLLVVWSTRKHAQLASFWPSLNNMHTLI
jgi:hypothetical protein